MWLILSWNGALGNVSEKYVFMFSVSGVFKFVIFGKEAMYTGNISLSLVFSLEIHLWCFLCLFLVLDLIFATHTSTLPQFHTHTLPHCNSVTATLPTQVAALSKVGLLLTPVITLGDQPSFPSTNSTKWLLVHQGETSLLARLHACMPS